jgi:hypothetical protein
MAEEALTLEQVKQAGQFAWHDIGYVCFRSSDDGDVWLPIVDLDGFVWDYLCVDPEDLELLQNGWHHSPGCDCESCAEDR